MVEAVQTSARVGDRWVHRFQVVREPLADGTAREWIVVDIDADAVALASPDFEWTRTVDRDALVAGRYAPLVAGDVPVWGY